MNVEILKRLRLLGAAGLICVGTGLLGCATSPLASSPSTTRPPIIEPVRLPYQSLEDMMIMPSNTEITNQYYDYIITNSVRQKNTDKVLNDAVMNVYKHRFGNSVLNPNNIDMFFLFNQNRTLFSHFLVTGANNTISVVHLDIPKEGNPADLLRAAYLPNNIILTEVQNLIITKESGEERKPDIILTVGKNESGKFVLIDQTQFSPNTWALVEEAAKKGNDAYMKAFNEYVTGHRFFDYSQGQARPIPLDPRKNPNGPFLLVPPTSFYQIIHQPAIKGAQLLISLPTAI